MRAYSFTPNGWDIDSDYLQITYIIYLKPSKSSDQFQGKYHEK